MSFWERLRDSFRGPLRVEGSDDPEVEADLAEEMPDAAEDAKETAESEEVTTRGGVPLASPLAPPTPETTAFEGEQEQSS
jgi:hypothetical protein